MTHPWLAPIRKASDREKAEMRRLAIIMGLLDQRISAAFMAAIERLGSQVDVVALTQLLEQGRVGEAIGLVNERLLLDGFKPLANEFTHAALTAGRDYVEAAAASGLLYGINAGFDATDAETVRTLRAYEFERVRQLSGEAVLTVRAAVTTGLGDGRFAANIAADVRDYIGLTEYQARAVMNFRRALETLDRRALDRALRDRRFDGTISRAIRDRAPLSQDQIDGMVERYRQRYLTYRAETIARTESARAANMGSRLSWEQMTRNGLIEASSVTRYWQHMHDSRVRDAHMAIPGMNRDGVGLHERFETPLGPLLYPGDPAGTAENVINCRCLVTYSVAVRRETLSAA